MTSEDMSRRAKQEIGTPRSRYTGFLIILILNVRISSMCLFARLPEGLNV